MYHLQAVQLLLQEEAGEGQPVTFTGNGCEKHYLPVVAWRDVVDSDEENDIYTLDGETLPSVNEQVCGTHGMEEMVRSFRKKMEEEIRADPTQPFPFISHHTYGT